ncbi:MAG TPA: helix-turn-helix domain-containing protein [Solirubrobacteraceae bacterium]|nr:helix-turn-helix domain-containing protein [Solirubrobacteraceae bacterium]
MSEDHPTAVSITLSPAQIDEVVRAATNSRAPTLAALIAGSLRAPLRAENAEGPTALAGERPGTPRPPAPYRPDDTDTRLSRSLLRGLSILTCFGPDGSERGIVELAADLGMSPSTAHRYALTLVELGLLERCPKSRKYRLPGTGI